MRNKSRGKLIALTLILVIVFTAAAGRIYRCYFAPLVNYSPYERIDFEQAEQRTGFRIPLPTYLPTGYVLEGIYMYPTPENAAKVTDAKLPPRPPFETFQVVFKRRTNVLVLRLYGGDTRSEESRANTGGDIPVDFGLSGESVNVNGATGLMQSDLDERSIFGTLSIRLARSGQVCSLTWQSATCILSIRSINLVPPTVQSYRTP